MFLFPYRLELPYKQRIKLRGSPFFTLLFSVACLLIFSLQVYSERQYEKRVINYCQHELTAEVIPVLKKVISAGIFSGCTDLMIDWDVNPENKNLDYFAYKAQITQLEQQVFLEELKRYNTIVLDDPLTVEWWHDPLNSEVTPYITSSFLHADWKHLFFNLMFFFVFSLIIEQLLGRVVYLLFFALCCITTGISYESDFFGFYSHLPTLGLSGVVMGLMALAACIYPRKKIAVLLWFLIVVTTIRVPLVLLVSFYVLSDIYGVAYLMNDNNVNYVAHLAGSITGVGFALLFYVCKYFFKERRNATDLGGEEGA